METIDNELWLQLNDGRLISMNKYHAQTMIDTGEAVLIPPERVGRTSPTTFALVPEPTPELATLAPPERAVSTKPGARTPA